MRKKPGVSQQDLRGSEPVEGLIESAYLDIRSPYVRGSASQMV